MEPSEFKDYYEILEISPNANSDTVDRIFRFLAQRYHPDIQGTGNQQRFVDIVKAHETLRNPETRAQYDIEYRKYVSRNPLQSDSSQNPETLFEDSEIQEKVLSLLHAKRRRNMNNPGLGNLELERLSGCPRELLEFHLWYLKEKGLISRLDNGLMSITANGVDRSNQSAKRSRAATHLPDFLGLAMA
ncbi:J domain-containing protein [Methylomicrobium lacus]|uniref:J domain-containing protein n=1 Tax=Methylomicrobium lacus TaxID=136992 RepID=UPI0035A8482A